MTAATSQAARRHEAALDVEAVRRDFPILRQRVHGKPLVYLDNAATTQKPTVVLEVIRQSDANTVTVIEGVKENLEALRAELPADVAARVIRDQSDYIYAAQHEISVHLVAGSVLASLVGSGVAIPALPSGGTVTFLVPCRVTATGQP